MLQFIIRIVFVLVAAVGLIFYYNVSKATQIAINDDIPSEDKLYQLQYCLDNSDCQLVTWHDCNQCEYVESVNSRFANYFYDNADYYNMPIGFNAAYCRAIKKIIPENTLQNVQYQLDCHSQDRTEEVVSAKCDSLIKQCYSICKDATGREHKCKHDTYVDKFFQIFVAPLIYQTNSD